MNIKFKDLIPGNFNENSHVWVFQSNSTFSFAQSLQIKKLLQNFISEWKIQDTPVKGYANLFFNQFIIFMADETATGVSRFSSEDMVALINNIQQEFEVELFNKLILAFLIEERIHLLSLSELNSAIEKDFIGSDTLYFNNTILTKKQLLNNWIIPVKKSWLALRIPGNMQVNADSIN
jgi:hypothetical protein